MGASTDGNRSLAESFQRKQRLAKRAEEAKEGLRKLEQRKRDYRVGQDPEEIARAEAWKKINNQIYSPREDVPEAVKGLRKLEQRRRDYRVGQDPEEIARAEAWKNIKNQINNPREATPVGGSGMPAGPAAPKDGYRKLREKFPSRREPVRRPMRFAGRRPYSGFAGGGPYSRFRSFR